MTKFFFSDSVAGLIPCAAWPSLSGTQEYIDKMPQAYNIYRSRKAAYQIREVESTLFQKTFAVEEYTKIKFIGFWDTLGALGNPLVLNGVLSRKNQFHDTGHTTSIEHAFHALSIDEKRKNFKATLWRQKEIVKNQTLEQVWFPGVHSDEGEDTRKAKADYSIFH